MNRCQLGVRARSVIALVALGAIGVSALARPVATVNVLRAGSSDVAMFQAVVARMREGEPYYAAMGDELRRGHYPASQAFNWRTPFLLSALAAVPPMVGRLAAIALCLALLVVTVVIMAHQPRTIAVTVLFLQSGVLMIPIVVPSASVMAEMWAGVLIGLSMCAYIRQRPMIGVTFGLLALFVRELSAPFCLVCTIVAIVNRRWREAAAWLSGALLYAAYYTWHLVEVHSHRLSSDLGHPSSWMEFGGLQFLLSKVQWHPWLLSTPIAASVLALLLLLAGIGATRTPIHVRLTSGVYVLFFLVAGKAFNQYWGMVAWPTWTFACGYGVDAIRESIRDAFGASRPSPSADVIGP